ncbi:MAG: hypothetical protein OXG68_10665 [Chloroflexi bacterium]|nr:hypothetical protein [Chloroflexota bacterium]
MKTLDFEYFEQQVNQENLLDVHREVQNRCARLRKRILHFSEQFGLPEHEYWEALEADPRGPLASTLAREARRQNIHEKHAADFIRNMEHVSDFEKLPAVGANARYLNSDGQFVTRSQLGRSPKPSKSLDFKWNTNGIRCLAAQKYTKEGGGNQDSQFNELELLLRNYLQRTNNGIALFVLVDGAYYNQDRLSQLHALIRERRPRSYVSSVNSLQEILHDIAAGR